MSFGPTVGLVAVSLACASGTAYVSLMHGGPHAPGDVRVLDRPVGYGNSYFDAAFASARATMRPRVEITAGLGPHPTFAARFSGIVSDGYAAAPAIAAATSLASAPTRSLARPATRSAKAAPHIRTA